MNPLEPPPVPCGLVNEMSSNRPATTPGLTMCSLCTGETLGSRDALPGGQLARMRRIEADGLARLTLSECLDECERGDVVIARPSTSGRAAGGRPVWFQRLAGDDPTMSLRRWLEQGGPGLSVLPVELESLAIDRTASRPETCH
jgi:(2Fe-2S) ferredoxin